LNSCCAVPVACVNVDTFEDTSCSSPYDTFTAHTDEDTDMFLYFNHLHRAWPSLRS
jgi:hypothetical protein